MIKIKNVTKKYGDTVILENCSYEFPSKGIVCLLGASGGGKTTLLNLLAGFDTDYEGDILVGGTSIKRMNAEELCAYRRDNTGFVFQNYNLLSGFSAIENVLLACEPNAQAKDVCLQKARAQLSRLGISEKENQKAETLSGGQKQRVAIARALVNNPQIIFADEPTGALDRATSTEIMEQLSEIASDRLVIVITHDKKICGFADEIIHIKDKTIVAEKQLARLAAENIPLKLGKSAKIPAFSRAKKNFSVHLKRYIAISVIISLGMLAFLFSLSFGNVTQQSVIDFQNKNTAFNNGYIKGADDGKIMAQLTADNRIENVYYQYILRDVRLSMNGKTERMAEKLPTPKATEGLSYGVMPRRGNGEIAVSPSLAKKFDSDIRNLPGKVIALEIGGQNHSLTISGIFNAGYDDFLLSSDIEQKLYESLPEQSNYSISYDVKAFSDIVAVSNSLKQSGLSSQNAADEVYALQTTFDSLNKLFLVISALILTIGLFICAVLLVKLQNTRYRELGLMSALGFSKKQIAAVISAENMLLSSLATAVNLALLGAGALISQQLGFAFIVSGVQILICVACAFISVALISGAASYKLLKTEPAEALRK